MGGLGSTRWNHHHRRRTIEETPRLKIDAITPLWRRENVESTQMIYRRDDEVIMSATIRRIDQNTIEIVTAPGNYRQRVTIARVTGCAGDRLHYFCDGCQRRRRDLYKLPHGALWRCRKCCALTYASTQHASRQQRARSLARLLRIADSAAFAYVARKDLRRRYPPD